MENSTETGTLYVIAAPSGTGKTTLVKDVIDSMTDVTVSISHTTRPKRPAETNGINYHFVDTAQFEKMIKNDEFLEHAHVFGHLYGTSKTWVKETLLKGKDVILEIDWQGTQQIQKLFPDCISIFVLPPSIDSLYQRLCNRKQDSEAIIKERISDVQEATKHACEYNYIVMNENFDNAVRDIKAIIHAGRLQQARQLKKYAGIINMLEHAKEK